MDKRGAEAIVAWVLLIGLSVSIGIMVSQWVKEQAEKQAENIVKEVQGDIKCADVSINAYFTDINCNTIDVSNRGYFKIVGLKIRPDIGTTETIDSDINPQQSQTLNIGYSTNKLDIIPIIKIEKEKLGCVDKKILIGC